MELRISEDASAARAKKILQRTPGAARALEAMLVAVGSAVESERDDAALTFAFRHDDEDADYAQVVLELQSCLGAEQRLDRWAAIAARYSEYLGTLSGDDRARIGDVLSFHVVDRASRVG